MPHKLENSTTAKQVTTMPGKGSKQPPDKLKPESPAPETEEVWDIIAKDLASLRAMITEQKVKNDEEGNILTKIEEANVHDMMNQAGAERDMQAIIKIVEHLSKTGPKDGNLKEFYKNTCFVLKNGSIDKLKYTAILWNLALCQRRNVHYWKVNILKQVNSVSSDWDHEKILEAKKKVKYLKGENMDVSEESLRMAKEVLQETYTRQAELKKGCIDKAKQQKKAACKPKQGEYKWR